MSGSEPSERYKVICPLARGGMGTVHLAARQEGAFVRLCVTKQLLTRHDHDPSFHAQLADEARLAGLIHHPNVVGVIDVSASDEGLTLVMDYIEGYTLSEVLRTTSRLDELVPVQVAARMIGAAARGLHAAHEQTNLAGESLNIIHRDISPQNILISKEGVPMVSDFGVARSRGRGHESTAVGVLKGKIGYMAPEMLSFEPIDRRIDIFALGILLYETLANRRLYASRSGAKVMEPADVARRIVKEPPPDIATCRADVPDALTDLLFRMLAKDPNARPATAADVADELDAVVHQLVGEEGVVDIKGWLEELMDDTVLRERRRLVVECLERDPAGSVEVVANVDGEGTRLRISPGASKTKKRALITLGATLAILTGVVAWVSTRNGEGDAATSTPVSEAPASETLEHDRVAHTPQPPLGEPAPVDLSSSDDEAADEEPDTDTPMTRRMRRPRNTMRNPLRNGSVGLAPVEEF